MSNNFKKIGIFGGSFNPPHLGHLRLAEAIIQKLSLDRMIIIPNKISPYKDSSEYASEADRLAMCRLNFSGSVFEVSTLEFDRRGKSYTYDTLCQIRELYPDAQLYLTVGSDMLYYFDKWYRYEDILEMCTLCAAERDGETNPIKKFGVPESLKGRKVLVFDDIEPLTVSSTDIRRKIRGGEDVAGALDSKVYQYISEGGLYRG